MRKIYTSILIALVIGGKAVGQEQKNVSDCIVNYTVSIQGTKDDKAGGKIMPATTKTLYIKGVKSRTDLETPNFTQVVIYDSKTDSSVVLRELGNAKYISYLDGKGRKDKNQKYEGIKFTETGETKTVVGYECRKVVAKLADGSSYNVFYTSSIVPSAGYEYQFKDLPGLVLEYEASFEQGDTRVTFTASNITFTPVPVAKFDVPKNGYRIL